MKKVLSFIKSWQFIFGIQVVLSLYFIYTIINTGLLLNKYIILVGMILAVLALITFLIMHPDKRESFRSRRREIIGKVISILVSILIIIASLAVNIGNTTLTHLAYLDSETYTYSVIVMDKSSYQNIQDLESKDIGTYRRVDDIENIDTAETRLRKSINFTEKNYRDVSRQVNALYNGNVDAILFNEAYRSVIEESKENFSKETRILWQTKVTVDVDSDVADIDVTQDSFNMYISGIDVAGSISSISRSDVNMVVTVNPQSREILLTSIPRDYYVTIAGINKKDKLTHTGLLGVNTTMNTMGNLLDTDMHFYSRVNFTSLVKVVDALGGIDVYSDKDLKAWTGKNIKKGMNHMDGETALAFARCRHAYTNGDYHRVKNQQDVLKAIINKMMSPTLLLNYRSILKAVDGTYQTSLEKDQITALVKMQMANNKAWKFKSYTLSGTGKVMKGGYFMPNSSLYYNIPKQSSVNKAKSNIKKVMNGESFD